jgi:hypothetical protein
MQKQKLKFNESMDLFAIERTQLKSELAVRVVVSFYVRRALIVHIRSLFFM